MRQRAERAINVRARTLYIGGGTPSLLTLESVERLVDTARRAFGLAVDAEITMEANPGTLDQGYLTGLRDLGLNRLSLGVQSADAADLRVLARMHRWEDSVEAVRAARRAGFGNVSLDLMFGLPDQTLEGWLTTLGSCLQLEPDHLSLYALTLEPGTPLAEAVTMGWVSQPDGDLAADMYEAASEQLQDSGFWQYEISNWARASVPAPEIWALPPDGRTELIGPHVCAHNLIYWRNEPWLGFGAGAHSWFRRRRWSNYPHPRVYINAIRSDETFRFDSAVLSLDTTVGEAMMMGMRLAEGVTVDRIADAYGADVVGLYEAEITRLEGAGLVTWDEQRLRLTARGRLLGNQVFEAFLLPES
jgi:oxygen-independent coproporphyrinogen-3 oxidase